MQKYIKHCYSKIINIPFFKAISLIILLGLTIFFYVMNSQPDIEKSKEIPETVAPPKDTVAPPKDTVTPPKDTEQPQQKDKIDTKIIHDFDSLGRSQEWEAFAMITPDETVCWISSTNLEAKKNDTSQKTSSLMLSIRFENQNRDEFSYHSQHNLIPEEKLNITIDNVVDFKLLPQEHWGWLKSSIDESRFVLAAQKGTRLMLSGKTTRDKKFQETYSLSGFTTAYKLAFNACDEAIQKKNKQPEHIGFKKATIINNNTAKIKQN